MEKLTLHSCPPSETRKLLIFFCSANANRHTATFVRHSCFSINIQMSFHPESAHASPLPSFSSSFSPSSSTRLYGFVSSPSPAPSLSLSPAPWKELKIAQDRVKRKGRLFGGCWCWCERVENFSALDFISLHTRNGSNIIFYSKDAQLSLAYSSD